MGKTGWTPGPWKMHEAGGGDTIEITTDERDDGWVEIAAIPVGFEGPIEDEQRACAALIAAAPNLARELQATADMLQRLLDDEEISDNARSEVAVQLQYSLAALSKAAPPQIEE